MSYKYDFLVCNMRAMPYHIGHHQIVLRALELAEQVIIILGSHKSSRTIRNPLTAAERVALIQFSFDDDQASKERILFHFQEDHLYNDDRWIAEIYAGVDKLVNKQWRAGPLRIGLIGYEKDATSYYLKLFPKWESEAVKPFKLDGKIVDATTIRNIDFGCGPDLASAEGFTEKYFVNEVAWAYWMHTIGNTGLYEEYEFVQNYKKQWEDSPYPPTFVTVDAVVTTSGHILVVERGAMPGKGLWALPGGFLDRNERVREGAIRELYEETKLAVPRAVIDGSIVKSGVYDHPNRSSRGRTITHAFHVALKDSTKLPKIKGSDDAAKAQWIPISDVMEKKELFFEDHAHIIADMLGL